jgi:hypothetical protein
MPSRASFSVCLVTDQTRSLFRYFSTSPLPRRKIAFLLYLSRIANRPLRVGVAAGLVAALMPSPVLKETRFESCLKRPRGCAVRHCAPALVAKGAPIQARLPHGRSLVGPFGHHHATLVVGGAFAHRGLALSAAAPAGPDPGGGVWRCPPTLDHPKLHPAGWIRGVAQ